MRTQASVVEPAFSNLRGVEIFILSNFLLSQQFSRNIYDLSKRVMLF